MRGVVYIDLTDETMDHYLLHQLAEIPDEAQVILYVGDRVFALPDSFRLIRLHLSRLEFDIHGSADAVRYWLRWLNRPHIQAVG